MTLLRLLCTAGRSLLLLAAFAGLAGCQSGSSQVGAPTAGSTDTLYVIFEGPWIFAADPNDGTKLLAISSTMQSHDMPYVYDVADSHFLPPGVYEIAITDTKSGMKKAPSTAPTLYKFPLDKTVIAGILAKSSARYAVRLPIPDGYESSENRWSRVGDLWPVVDSAHYKEANYTTGLALRYDQADLGSIALSGTPDSALNSFTPASLSVGTPRILRVNMEAHLQDAPDPCSMQSKQAFMANNGLMGSKLFVDYPQYSVGCQKTDPQNSHAAPPIDPFKALDALKVLVQKSPVQRPTGQQVREASATLQFLRINFEIPMKMRSVESDKTAIESLEFVQQFLSKALDRNPSRDDAEKATKALGVVRTVLEKKGPGGKDCKAPILDVGSLTP